MRAYDEQNAFLTSLCRPRLELGIRLDLSKQPHLFDRLLRVKGLYIYGRAFTPESRRLSELALEVTIFNETDLSKVTPEAGRYPFYLRDWQEFRYVSLVGVPKPPRKYWRPESA